MKLLHFTSFALCLVLAFAEQWNSANDPNSFQPNMNKQFKSLGTSGKLSHMPWSDTYWPSYQSGIANRWNSNNPQNFNYKLYSKSELLSMSLGDLKTLSPAEKFDIYNSRYDYPTVNSEWKRTSPNDATWEGLCHGWAPASLAYQQPHPVTMKNPDGISIPFGSSDIKALLTYFVGEYDERTEKTFFISERCQYDLQSKPEYETSSSCADMNAGTLHVLLSNLLGSKNFGWVVDRDRSIQVWNQPLYSFTSKIMSSSLSSSSSSSSNVVQITTDMTYGKETTPTWEVHDTKLVTETYTYTIEVDNNGMITGGSYSSWDRPDFGWMTAVGNFRDYFSTLKDIYSKSIGTELNDTSRLVHLSNQERPHPSSLRNHKVLQGYRGEFGTNIAHGNYSNNYRASWSIHSSSPSHELLIRFTEFDTERVWDKVRVYEGATGEGALLAVLYGQKEGPIDILVHAPAAYVVFVSDGDGTAGGFEATFISVSP